MAMTEKTKVEKKTTGTNEYDTHKFENETLHVNSTFT